jgi:hypothetical protein
VYIQIFLKKKKTIPIKQGYHKKFNISLFTFTIVKTCHNVNIDFILFLQVCQHNQFFQEAV